MKLSERLTTVSNYIPKDSVVADIGSDHAYLPIYIIQNGMAKKAIAGEVAEGPFQSATSSVKEAGLQSHIKVRKGDGLEVINNSDKVNCITIAGMGGPLITSILDEGQAKLTTVERLILQPNIAAQTIRKWLLDHSWLIIDEKMVEEDGHIYEIVVAERGSSESLYKELEKELFFGPYLLREKSSAFVKKWTREKLEWERIFQQLEKAEENQAIIEKKKELIKYIEWYREEIGQ